MDGGAPSETGPGPARASDDSWTPAHAGLVEAAVQLVVEHHDRDVGAPGRRREVFPFLSLARIARRAGVSRGTIYHHWRVRDAGTEGVLDRLLDEVAGELWSRSVEPDEVLPTSEPIASGPEGEPSFDDVVLAASESEAARVSGPSRHLLRSSQALTVHGASDPRAAESLLDEITTRCATTIAAFGRRVAEPLTTADVAFLLSVAAEGAALLATSGRDVLERRFPRPGNVAAGAGDVSLLSVVVHAILTATLTDEVPAGDAQVGSAGHDAATTPRSPTADAGGDVGDAVAAVSAGAASRHRIIDAAVELALEHYAEPGPGDPRVSLAYLTPGAVARRAGTSRSLLYHHWGDGGDAFRRFLDDTVAEVWRRSVAPGERVGAADDPGADTSERVRVLSNAEGRRSLGPDGSLVRAGQALLLDGLVEAGSAGMVNEGLSELYRELAADGGTAPAGMSPLDVADAIDLLCEGYWLQGNVLPGQLERSVRWSSRAALTANGSITPTDDWTLLAVAVDAVLAAALDAPAGTVSSRRPPAGPRSRPG